MKSWVLRHAPHREVRPGFQLLRCPGIRFVRMAHCTGVGNLVLLARSGRDESERVAADVRIRDCLHDGWHMARHTLATGAAGFVVSMLFQASARAIRSVWTMALQAHDARGLQKIGVVFRPLHVVTIEAGDSPLVHAAVNEIVPLHPVLVGCAVGKVRETSFSQPMLFQRPNIA